VRSCGVGAFFVATVGNVTADIVKKYVEEQWEKEK